MDKIETSKLDRFEIVVGALTRKVLTLKSEIEEIKPKKGTLEKRVLKTLWPPIIWNRLTGEKLRKKRNMKVKKTLLKPLIRMKQLMIMFKSRMSSQNQKISNFLCSDLEVKFKTMF